MRREFILVLLGILSFTILSSFVGYGRIDTGKVLLDTVVGYVGSGNFSYWQLHHKGPLLLELSSFTGDADLYVSDGVRPSYEIDRNNFSSATCGPDLVNIPADFPRPIGVGVFGHWSHSQSKYCLQVFLDASAAITDAQLKVIESVMLQGNAETADAEKRNDEKFASKKTSEENKPRFIKLLSILDIIFEMFVL